MNSSTIRATRSDAPRAGPPAAPAIPCSMTLSPTVAVACCPRCCWQQPPRSPRGPAVRSARAAGRDARPPSDLTIRDAARSTRHPDSRLPPGHHRRRPRPALLPRPRRLAREHRLPRRSTGPRAATSSSRCSTSAATRIGAGRACARCRRIAALTKAASAENLMLRLDDVRAVHRRVDPLAVDARPSARRPTRPDARRHVGPFLRRRHHAGRQRPAIPQVAGRSSPTRASTPP